MNIQGKLDSPAVKIYQITYLFGLAFGSGLYMAVNWVWPAPGIGVSESFDTMKIEGVAATGDDCDEQHDLPGKDAVFLRVRDVKE
jgi:hypothetical protein